MEAGKLRHRVTIQKKDKVQDPISGEILFEWVDIWKDIPASIDYLSVRDYMGGLTASQTPQAKITARITIRYRDGINAEMRILHKNKIFDIKGLLQDNNLGLEYITIPVSEGTNLG